MLFVAVFIGDLDISMWQEDFNCVSERDFTWSIIRSDRCWTAGFIAVCKSAWLISGLLFL